MFIVLEGVDGCGKSTQAKRLAEWMKDRGRNVFLTAEPTSGKVGLFLREMLAGKHKVDPKTIALIFTADRIEHLKNEIEPALTEGKTVISERYYHSTIAYQAAQDVPWDWLVELNKFARKPDLTLFLDVDVDASVERTKGDEIFENKDFLEKVRDNYLKFDRDVVKINGDQSVDEVFEEIKDKVLEFEGER